MSVEQEYRRRVEARATMDVEPAAAWAYLRDLSIAHRYVPGIVRTEITTGQREGVGTSRIVYDARGSGLRETVIEWNEGQGFLLRLGEEGERPPFPLERALFRYHIEPAEAGRTRIVLRLCFELRGGALGRWLEPLLLPVMRRRNQAVADAMKAEYERMAASASR